MVGLSVALGHSKIVKAGDGQGRNDFTATFDKLSDLDIESSRYVPEYIEGIRRALRSKPLRMLSCAPDKSSVDSIGMFNSPYALPDNFVFWGAPQDPS